MLYLLRFDYQKIWIDYEIKSTTFYYEKKKLVGVSRKKGGTISASALSTGWSKIFNYAWLNLAS